MYCPVVTRWYHKSHNLQTDGRHNLWLDPNGCTTLFRQHDVVNGPVDVAVRACVGGPAIVSTSGLKWDLTDCTIQFGGLVRFADVSTQVVIVLVFTRWSW
jgi:thiamine pyrophosphokinase